MHLSVAELGARAVADHEAVLHIAGHRDLEHEHEAIVGGHLVLDGHALVAASDRVLVVAQFRGLDAQYLQHGELVGFRVAGDDLHDGLPVRVLYLGGVRVGRDGQTILRQVAEQFEGARQCGAGIGRQCGAGWCPVGVAADLELSQRHHRAVVDCGCSHDSKPFYMSSDLTTS